MCDTCGCENNDQIRITGPDGKEQILHKHPESGYHSHDEQSHDHDSHYHHKKHSHDKHHDHHHKHHHDKHHHDYHKDVNHTHAVVSSGEAKMIRIEKEILSANDLQAEHNRGFFEAKRIIALNLVSSPGSGKTTLLEQTIRNLHDELSVAVIEGDQQTTNDAERILAAGAQAVQINTGSGCHLDASMIYRAMHQLKLKENSVLFIENVGNLVCPAMFDLGESRRIVIISVTEGDDKPLKYPDMFRTSQLCIINKTDLLPYVDFSTDRLKEYALRINPGLQFIELSARNGNGIDIWCQWLKKLIC